MGGHQYSGAYGRGHLQNPTPPIKNVYSLLGRSASDGMGWIGVWVWRIRLENKG